MIDDKHAPTEIRVPLPPRPARHLPVQQPSIRYVPGSVPLPIIESASPHPHPVDVRRPRHARPEDVVAQPSWWRRERTHLYAGVAGGGLVLFVAALVYVTWAVLG